MFAFLVTVIPAVAGAVLLGWETNWKIGGATFLFFMAIWLTVFFRNEEY